MLPDVNLHWLITGRPSPDTEEIVKRLKPFVYAHLAEVAQRLQKQQNEYIRLGDQFSSEEIQNEIRDLHLYYKAVLDALNEPLNQLDIQI